ncbi:MAG: hypothetical protein HY960_06100 [Ignavibacteriae bacterium]|nr:hypothetical protein [Ignavibacteriota bacterium]
MNNNEHGKLLEILMKLKFTITVAILLIISLSGCDLMTDKEPLPAKAVGNDLIINEVYTISPDKFYSYSWIELFNPTNHNINVFNYEFPAEGWAVGSGGVVLHTTNTGATWDDTLTGVVPKFNSIDFFTEDTLFAVGDKGKIYRSNDKGKTWFVIYTFSNQNINLYSNWVLSAYSSPNAKLQWVCGDSGVILTTANRGVTWSKVKIDTTGTNVKLVTNKIRSIFATDVSPAMACGDSIILRLNSFAIGWQAQAVPRKVRYHSIRFLKANSSSSGRCVGDNGTILYTSNGGATWNLDASGVTANLKSVAYVNEGYAWAVGENGTIVNTRTQGFSTWTSQNSGTTVNLNHVEFVDSVRGFIYGDGGLVLYTFDGGLNWRQQSSGTTENLLAGTFVSPFLTVSQSAYVLKIYGERRHIFFQPPFDYNPDFITKVDTGNLYLQAQGNATLKPGNFFVVTSDEDRFDNHFSAASSNNATLLALDVAAVFSSDRFDSIFFQQLRGDFKLAKWSIFPSSEIRLLRVSQLNSTVTDEFLGLDAVTLEVVRFGDVHITVDYPHNKPAPEIPEWWSIARYADKVDSDINTFNSAEYFYKTNSPIPGWVSQLRSK